MNPEDSVERELATLMDCVRREIALVMVQIDKSRSLRGASPLKRVVPTTPSETIRRTVVAAEGPTRRSGVLQCLGRKRLLQRFERVFVVLSPESKQLSWWPDEVSSTSKPPTDSIPFVELVTNSRGSRFRKAAKVCPIVDKDDVPELPSSKDSLVCFGLSFYNPQNQQNLWMVFGAADADERDRWVVALAQYVDIYLPPRQESAEYARHFKELVPVTSPPLYVDAVLDGEAPK